MITRAPLADMMVNRATPALALAVAGLNDELRGEDVGQLGSIAVPASSHLQA